MAELIIEVVEHGRRKGAIHRFDGFPVRIGRGYGNDLVLSDEYVSPEHLVISRDGQGFAVEDLGTENGISVKGRCVRNDTVNIESGDTVMVAGLTLRIFSPSHPVPPARMMSRWSTPGRKLLFRALVWASMLLLFCVCMLDEYIGTYEKIRLSELMDESVPILIIALIWAGFWASLGYSVQRNARFHSQLLIANVFLIAFAFFKSSPDVIGYCLNLRFLEEAIDYAVFCVMMGFLFHMSVGVATRVPRRQKAIISGVIAVVISLVALVVTVADRPDFESDPTYDEDLHPPYVPHLPGVSIDKFLGESEEVFTELKDD